MRDADSRIAEMEQALAVSEASKRDAKSDLQATQRKLQFTTVRVEMLERECQELQVGRLATLRKCCLKSCRKPELVDSESLFQAQRHQDGNISQLLDTFESLPTVFTDLVLPRMHLTNRRGRETVGLLSDH
jgi:hypothetical protein